MVVRIVGKNESEIIMKVTTDFKQGEALFQSHAQFLTRAYEYLGVKIFVEAITGGAIFFYRSLGDFEKFHEFSTQVPVTPSITLGMPTFQGEKTLTVTNVFVRLPPNPPIEILLETMERAHRRISPNIKFVLVPPNTIQMHYNNVGDFNMAFKNVWEALGKKVTPAFATVQNK